MSSNLENFRPKLRAGKVTPRGPTIVFETETPFNQIILPMALADLILLCGGRFSIREIVEKIYRKQGVVPFKAILRALHILHQGGFFENGHELELNKNLRSWVDKSKTGWVKTWRFGTRVEAHRRSPTAYYGLTLFLLVASLFGFQVLPKAPLKSVLEWGSMVTIWGAALRLFVCASLVQSGRYFLRGLQLLLLSGKAYNISLKLSLGGIHIHVGDEATDIFENRLYIAMFHVSQIFMGWFFVLCFSQLLSPIWFQPLLLFNCVLSFWETNPFIGSEGLKLIQSLIFPGDSDILSWHFEASSLIQSLHASKHNRSEDFSRICTIWGVMWLTAAFFLLYRIGIVFTPITVKNLARLNASSFAAAAGIFSWFGTLYLMVQTFIERLGMTLLHPTWLLIRGRLRAYLKEPSREEIPTEDLLEKVQDLPLFSHFHEPSLLRILENSVLMEFREGTPIINHGDVSRRFFVLLEGSVEVTRHTDAKSEWVIELGAVSIFGESALIEDLPRASQVRAKTQATVLSVPVEIVRTVAQESQVVRHLDDFRNAIMVNQFFASSPVFRSLSNSSIEFLCSRGTLEFLGADSQVFVQGESGDGIYLILRGSVDITINHTHVKSLSQGSFFGEIALIASIPRTATVVTVEPCVLFKITADAFWEVLVQNMDLGVFIETISENRMREDVALGIYHKAG